MCASPRWFEWQREICSNCQVLPSRWRLMRWEIKHVQGMSFFQELLTENTLAPGSRACLLPVIVPLPSRTWTSLTASGGLLQSTGGVRETFGAGFVGKFGSGASFFEEEIKGLCQNQTRETAWTCPRVSCIHTSRLSTGVSPNNCWLSVPQLQCVVSRRWNINVSETLLSVQRALRRLAPSARSKSRALTLWDSGAQRRYAVAPALK